MTQLTTNATSNQRFVDSPILLNPVTYWRVSAFALTAVAVLGFVVNIAAGNNEGIPDLLKFDWAHNVVHVVLAGAAFFFGFANVSERATKIAAILFGFVYGALAVVGFIGGMTLELFNLLSLEFGENLIHTLLAVWALAAGFSATPTD